MTDFRMRNPFRRFRRLVAALLIPFVLVWSIMIPRQAFAFAPVGAAPIVIVGSLASGAVVPIVIGAAIAGVAYWAFQDLMSGDEVRVPAVEGAGGVPPAPTDAPASVAPTVKYSFGSSGLTCDGTFSSSSDSAGDACTLLGNSVLKTQNSNAGYSCANRYYESTQATLTSSSTCNVTLTKTAEFGGGQVDFGTTNLQFFNSCGNGYTLVSNTCSLTNARATDVKKDYQRSGAAFSPYSGELNNTLSASTITSNSANDTVVVAGKDADGNAMQGQIIALPSGGSKVELKTQKVDAGGQTYVETQTFQTSSAGDVVSATKTAAQTSLTYDPTTKTYTENPNPSDSYSPAPATQQAIQFPSDYARQGEAASAAQSISNTLGPKIDAITNTGDDPVDPLLPEASVFNDAFFSGTFNNLLGWQLPAHSSECPTGSFDWNGGSYAVDSHCQLINSHFGTLSGAMAVVWTVAALFLLLRA